ncbi:antiviral reverse transcriptase Drt4 [Alteromonas stellipolaris]|uniref:antiviral reverse transcriptase Drt4 n=1 Tax=Alteromonas stellipolaris TaxID=233316 RepID=UPI0027337AC2|nr:antiviral reverse transcriptase Drt4 [Alteromonas stellipolaris]MDP2595136.1 antiviral reverse transcriptase Drt4 [Alteromonas stellipolaris]
MAIIIGDTDNKRSLFESLTRYNYFPNQRVSVGELPPSISTRQFTPEVAQEIAAKNDDKERRTSGYDLVEYKATRYNNVPRVLGLIHPKAYALLAKCVYENWGELKSISNNSRSIVKPEFHQEEERLMVMNYEEPLAKVARSHQKSFSKRFRVEADIANCFNSIYSHAIPWAAVGFSKAKREQGDKNAWFNKLDTYQRKTKRNETLGVPIGPATSSIVAELILGEVDGKLCSKGYDFYRYIDDYTCYCKNDEEAQQFIQDLTDELALYKLTLNLKKTVIIELPCAVEAPWVLELRGALPSRLNHASEHEPKLSAAEVLTYINRAIELNKATPDGSVLKYAVSLVLPHLNEGVAVELIEPLFNLSWHFPVLLPFLDSLMQSEKIDAAIYHAHFMEIIKINAVKRRSDGMAWPLHSLLASGSIVDDEVANRVIESKDCVSICLLLEMGVFEQQIVDFVNDWLVFASAYEKDSYWLLLYQLYRKELIKDPYGDGVFDILKNNDVNFLPGDKVTEAEKKCDEVKRDLTSAALKWLFQASEINGKENEDKAEGEPPAF